MSARKLRKFFKNSDELSIKKAQSSDMASPSARMKFALSAAAMSVTSSKSARHASLNDIQDPSAPHFASSSDSLFYNNLTLNQSKLSKLAGMPVHIHTGRTAEDFKKGILESRIDQVLADNKGGVQDLLDQGKTSREKIGQEMVHGLDETAKFYAEQQSGSHAVTRNGQPEACHIFINLGQLEQNSDHFASRQAGALKMGSFETVSLTPSTRLAALLVSEAKFGLRDDAVSPEQNMAMRSAFAVDTLDSWGADKEDMSTLKHLKSMSLFTTPHLSPSLFETNHPYQTYQSKQHFAEQQAKATILDLSRQVDGPQVSVEEMFIRPQTSENALLRQMTAAYELRDGAFKETFDEQGPEQQQTIRDFIQASETLMPDLAKKAQKLAHLDDEDPTQKQRFNAQMRMG